MIEHISIKNYATISHIEMDFGKGLTAITGETGAGKSIIIGAISLAFFGRADKSVVRYGEDKMRVQVVLEDASEDLILTREVSATGKSLCKLGDEIVPLNALMARTQSLIDIHGQYDNQRLLDPASHIDVLDDFGQRELGKYKVAVASSYEAYREKKKTYDGIVSDMLDAKAKIAKLSEDISRIDAMKLISNEDERLSESIELMQRSEDIRAVLEQVVALDTEPEEGDEPTPLRKLARASEGLNTLSDINSQYMELSSNMSDSYYVLAEVVSSCNEKLEALGFKSGDLDEAISRLEQIDELKLEFGDSLDEVLAYKDRAIEQVGALTGGKEKITLLKDEVEQKLTEFKEACETLSQARSIVATKLEKEIETELLELNFKNAEFKINLDTAKYSKNGMDSVSFYIRTNAGLPLAPMVKIASGGEVSRIMLAIKSALKDHTGFETMLFDEIDTGISGVTASIVGKKLKEMSKTSQIIVITHLPQIAAYADEHLVIDKTEGTEETITSIKRVFGEDRTNEVARLLSGNKISENTMLTARELIARSALEI